jgi:repressor LexA
MFVTKRQNEILEYLRDHIERRGYAPTIEEIAEHCDLRSLATVHKHLSNLQQKGLIRRETYRSRGLEIVPQRASRLAVELPLLGKVAAGAPIEAVTNAETVSVPEELAGRGDTFVLRVQGDSMIDEQIRDGDYVVVENRHEARDGEMVVALLEGQNTTLKKWFREPSGRVRLQPANRAMAPLILPEVAVQVQGVVIAVLRKY